MNQRSLMILSAMVGAAVGAGVGFVLFTERGRRLRAEWQPEIVDVVKEAMRLGQVADLWNDRPAAVGGTGARPAAWPRRSK